ncbi:hypothetical protein [Streptomyces sp. NPDC059788]|uniref:hypothetical protein n=1 Tax=Streptomyces sp. NPDC059788 TaxID=3346948 RepID=UPI003663FE58
MNARPVHPVTPPPSETPPGPGALTHRHPTVADTGRVHALARRSGVSVTRGACRMCCGAFARTSMVADLAGTAIGFIGGYRRPAAPQSYVAWHLVFPRDHAGAALALMAAMAESVRHDGAESFEIPIGPDSRTHVVLVQELARTYHAVPDTSTLAGPSRTSPGGDMATLYRFALTGGRPVSRPAEPRTCPSHNSRY